MRHHVLNYSWNKTVYKTVDILPPYWKCLTQVHTTYKNLAFAMTNTKYALLNNGNEDLQVPWPITTECFAFQKKREEEEATPCEKLVGLRPFSTVFLYS